MVKRQPPRGYLKALGSRLALMLRAAGLFSFDRFGVSRSANSTGDSDWPAGPSTNDQAVKVANAESDRARDSRPVSPDVSVVSAASVARVGASALSSGHMGRNLISPKGNYRTVPFSTGRTSNVFIAAH